MDAPPSAPSTHAASTTHEHPGDTQTDDIPASTSNDRTILIGLSGPSSSGKTTIARLLAQIFTHTSLASPAPSELLSPPPVPAPPRFRSSSLHILHQDDFYLTDTAIPLTTTPANCASGLGARELLDWDCASSLDVALLAETLVFVKRRGKLPEGAVSKEDLNSVGPVDVREGVVRELGGRVGGWLGGLGKGENGKGEGRLRIWIVDGFLLYPPPPPASTSAPASASASAAPTCAPASASAPPNTPSAHPPPPQTFTPGVDSPADVSTKSLLHATVTSLLDIKLLLLSSRTQTIARRTRRTGYVTLEGFWEDPEGYVEDVVWPNYVRDGVWLMRRKDDREREGKREEDSMVDVDEEVAGRQGIRFVPGEGGADLSEVLVWAAEEVMRGVERVLGGEKDLASARGSS